MTKVGIERLQEYSSLFKDKRVGLITNPTGVDRNMTTTIDILNEHTNLVALFSPEHGIRGSAQAGVKVDDYVDEETGIMVYSLYGKNRRPQEAWMKQIDVLAFDMQGVGLRFYTFLYTLGYAIEACAKYNKKIVVFDRPNPLGDTIEGNIIKEKYDSFVGRYRLVQRYGLTIGEYATYVNAEMDINADLTVVPMEGYSRNMTYRDTGLPWVLPSPNIPTMETPFYYAATCIFEGTTMSEGRGTTKPFHMIGAPWLDAKAIIEKMNNYKLPGILFRFQYFTPTFSKHEGEQCTGIELIITNYNSFKPIRTGMILLKVIQEYHNEFQFRPPWVEGQRQMIDLLTGDDFLRLGTLDINQILNRMDEDEQRFKTIQRRYQIYA